VSANPAIVSAAAGPSNVAQLFGVFAGPVVWNAQLVVNYAFAAYPCFDHSVRRTQVLAGWEHQWIALLIVNVVAIAVIAIAFFASWRAFVYGRAAHSESELLDRYARRTRAFGIVGMLSSGIFIVAAVGTLIALLVAPQCSI